MLMILLHSSVIQQSFAFVFVFGHLLKPVCASRYSSIILIHEPIAYRISNIEAVAIHFIVLVTCIQRCELLCC